MERGGAQRRQADDDDGGESIELDQAARRT
jgi:hypothetical protein